MYFYVKANQESVIKKYNSNANKYKNNFNSNNNNNDNNKKNKNKNKNWFDDKMTNGLTSIRTNELTNQPTN